MVDSEQKVEAFRAEFQDWLRRNLPDGWLDGNQAIPLDPVARERMLRDWQKTLGAGGWSGIAWPVELGGRDASALEQAVYEECLAEVNAPPILSRAGVGMIGHVLAKIGTEQQREKYIPRMLSGEDIWCLGLSEPDAGSDLANVRTRAERNGDTFTINGSKIWTSVAHIAQRCFLLARTTPNIGKHKGLTAFIVDMADPGVTVRPIEQMNGEYEFNEVFFDNVVVSVADVVGEVDGGWSTMMLHLGFERGFVASMAFRLPKLLARVADLRLAVGKDLSAREAGIADDQLARLYARVEAAVLTYRRTLFEAADPKQDGGIQALVKLMCTELNKDIYEFGLWLLKADGVYWPVRTPTESSWQYDYLTSFSLTLGGGTAEIQRNIIGERLLGLPRDARG